MNADTLQQRYEAYNDAFAAIADDERERLLRSAVSESVNFTSPIEDGHGARTLIQHVVTFQKQNPGAFFSIDSALVQHDQILVAWTLHLQSGAKPTGHTYARAGEQGLITHLAGFFEKAR